MYRHKTREAGVATVLVALFALHCVDSAMAQSQQKGDATLGIEYQYVTSDTFYDGVGKYKDWSTDSHAIIFSGDYAISDRWTVYAALPYVRKRFVSEVDWGGDPHNPNDYWWIDFVPPDKRFVDHGGYHGGFQDMSVGIRYLALEGPLTIAPYIGYGFPTTDYPFYAKSAIGKNLWTVPLGVSLSYVPYFSDWHFRGNLAYVFSEKPLGVNVDYWLAYASTGYWFRPYFAMDLFLSGKWTSKGLEMPWDFTDDPTYSTYPDEFDTIEWWQHDRLIGNRSLDVGVAFYYFFNERTRLSGSVFTGIWAEQSNETDYAITLALTRHLSGD